MLRPTDFLTAMAMRFRNQVPGAVPETCAKRWEQRSDSKKCSLPEIDMAPENWLSEDEFDHFGMAYFSGAMLVWGNVYTPENNMERNVGWKQIFCFSMGWF